MSTPAWFTRDLHPGDESLEVTVVQRKLGADLTGVMDEDTVRRVRGLQHSTGMKVDGIVGRQTASKVGERARKGMPPVWFSRHLFLGCEGPDVREARKMLGLLPGDVFDVEADRAVRRAQSERDYSPTGELDVNLAQLLSVD